MQKVDMLQSCKVAIVAALEREVWPLIKEWTSSPRQVGGREFKFYEKDGVAVVCGGIGPEAARRASEAVFGLYHPEVMISAGFAGALDPALEVGETLTARHVIDASDGSRTDCASGMGVLVSFGDVADVHQKAKLGAAYGAHAVDMEAAAVARSAEAHGVTFLACKAISDTSSTALPPIGRFMGPDGKFHALNFVAYVTIRPWLWSKVLRLQSNSRIAAKNLCRLLAETTRLETTDRVLTR